MDSPSGPMLPIFCRQQTAPLSAPHGCDCHCHRFRHFHMHHPRTTRVRRWMHPRRGFHQSLQAGQQSSSRWRRKSQIRPNVRWPAVAGARPHTHTHAHTKPGAAACCFARTEQESRRTERSEDQSVQVYVLSCSEAPNHPYLFTQRVVSCTKCTP